MTSGAKKMKGNGAFTWHGGPQAKGNEAGKW